MTAGNKTIAFGTIFLSDVPLQPSQLFPLLTQHTFEFNLNLNLNLNWMLCYIINYIKK